MKLLVIHYNPIESYPPAINFLYFLGKTDFRKSKINVITTNGKSSHFQEDWCLIKRLNGVQARSSFLIKMYLYFIFNTRSLMTAILTKPTSIIYYETLSCFPGIIYKLLFNRKCRLIVHYHEYTSVEEYNKSSLYYKLLHLIEKRNYSFIDAVSHTNLARMKKFVHDTPQVERCKKLILPNYPPRSWQNSLTLSSLKFEYPVKFVYVGALSLEYMYIEEICHWVAQSENVLLDIYTNNIDSAVSDFLSTLNSEKISLKGFVNYQNLPNILKKYHIGLILYKGKIDNQIYLAPNKLFEYLICGLSVWFPTELLGSYEYINQKTFPLVLKVNFREQDSLNHAFEKYIVDSENPKIDRIPQIYNCEDVFSVLLGEIV